MEIKKVGVVGCGFMGSGITQCAAQAGYEVVVTDVSESVLEKGLSSISYFLGRAVEKGKMTQWDRDLVMSRIKGTTDMGDLSRCDIAIEVVTEDLEIKKTIFAELDRICPKRAIISSNTSCLPVIELAAVTGRPQKVLGTHFLSPVPLSRLLELVRTVKTSDETLAVARKFGESLGKEIIVARDTPGFVFNRQLIPWQLNAIRMLEAGVATAEEIDSSMTLGLSYPIGPLALTDFNGLDVAFLVAKAMYEETKDPLYAPPIMLKRMVAAGLLGRKSGRGFYDYTDPPRKRRKQ